MTSTRTLIQFTAFAIPLGFMVIALAGCGDGRPDRVKVQGKIFVDGTLLEYGGIEFKPSGGGRKAGGVIKDGVYSTTMYKENDGLPPGTYTVSIDPVEFINARSQRLHAPKRYSDHETSGLTVEVTEATSDMNFELTWEGDKHDKPWVERY